VRALYNNRERGFGGAAPESDRGGQQNASAFASGGPTVPPKAPLKDGMNKQKTSKNNWLTWLEAEQRSSAEVGGKAWNLGRLVKAGFLVPTGGVVPCHVYQNFLRAVGVLPACQKIIKKIQNPKALAQAELEKELAHIREKIEQGRFPAALRQELGRQWKRLEVQRHPVAVRSSSSVEDCEQASCAGMYSSFLHVIGIDSIFEHVRKCYASCWTLQTILYMHKMKISPGDMAVVIMHMIPAESAGVAFTCEPRTGNREIMVVNASWGLGEAVVNGRVDPDTYHFSATSQVPLVVHTQIGSKEGRVLPQLEGGTRFEPFASSESKMIRQPVFTAAQQAVLGWNINRLRSTFLGDPKPLDLEWVFDGTHFYWLQMRPVTVTLKQSGHENLAAESTWLYSYFTPGVQSPLSWSIMEVFLGRMFLAPFQAVQYVVERTQPIVRRFQGSIYFNLSFLEQAMYSAFGILPEMFGEEFGVLPQAKAKRRTSTVREQWGWGWRSLLCLGKMLWQYWRADLFFQDVDQLVKHKLRDTLASAGEQELIEQGRQIFTRMEEKRFAVRSQLLYIFASVMYSAVTSSLKPLFGDKSGNLVNVLLTSDQEMNETDYNFHLGQIVRIIQEDPKAISFFAAKHFDPKAWKKRLPEDSPAHQAFKRFLDLHGHRGVEEIDLKNPRWQEDPTYVLECLRQMVKAKGFIAQQEQKQLRRIVAWQTIKKQALPWRVLWIRFLVRHALKSAAIRERTKSANVLPLSMARQIALEMGQRLSKRKLFRQQTDVFYCNWPELVEVLERRWDGKALDKLIQLRREEEQIHRKQQVQERIDVVAQKAPSAKSSAQRSNTKRFQGLGIAAGTVRARARRIQHPNEGHKLKPGDILVTSFVDPGWTPLLLQVSGLVLEKGGYLSHGAIVAREYGIPAVSNVHGILEQLKDNQIITVDGDQGTVTI
jgi:rifampicin phosphotransferase